MTVKSEVRGERAAARIVSPRSLAVRMQRTFAVALALLMGLALLTWYYLHLGTDAKSRGADGAAGLLSAVASEMRLPALAPAAAIGPSPGSHASAAGATADVDDTPAAHGWAAPRAPISVTETPDALAAESRSRQLAPVLSRPPTPITTVPADPLTVTVRDPAAADEPTPGGGRASGERSLAESLQPTFIRPAEAAVIPSRRWLLPKGSFLDCTLETAVDSTFAGLATCVLATDVFGADGRVVLMERGTKLVGETRSEVRAGQARVAILWNEARTPTGVILSLNSPGTDALGRAGVAGTVDRHTGERFGAAVLLSVLDAAVGGLVARGAGPGAIFYNAQSAHDVATEALRNTISIPPTISVAPGARVMVSVVRDIDFRAVYRLVAHEDR